MSRKQAPQPEAVNETKPEPTYVFTKQQLLSIVGSNYDWHPREEKPDDALRLACSTLHQASNEIDVLRRLLYDDEVSNEKLDMVFFHLSNRLEMIAQVAMAKGSVQS